MGAGAVKTCWANEFAVMLTAIDRRHRPVQKLIDRRRFVPCECVTDWRVAPPTVAHIDIVSTAGRSHVVNEAERNQTAAWPVVRGMQARTDAKVA